jgi:hypothetical protein
MDDAGKSGKEFWFNSRTKEVDVGKQSLAIYRIGPFHSAAEALNAYEVIRVRNQAWDDADADWDAKAND